MFKEKTEMRTRTSHEMRRVPFEEKIAKQLFTHAKED